MESLKEPLDENSIDDVARYFMAMARLMEAIQARNSMLAPLMRRQGFFGREKRAALASDDSLDMTASRVGMGQRSE